MSDLRTAIDKLPEPDKSLGVALMDYYERMKQLEADLHRGGKQATLTVMTMNDIKTIFK